MTFVITQPCIDTMDQSCVEVCPVDCIHFEEGADRMLYINPAECIDCGACQPACPVSAIFPENDVPPEAAPFTVINAQWYENPAAARQQVEGGAVAGAAAPTAAAAAAPTGDAPVGAADVDRDANAASQATADAAAAAPAPAAAAQAPAHTAQVAAVEDEHAAHGPVQVPHYDQPSPFGILMLLGTIVGFVIIFMVQEPVLLRMQGFAVQGAVGPELRWDGGITLGVLLGIPLTLFFLGGFLQSQVDELSRFAAQRERAQEVWRGFSTIWTRSEETRRYDQERAVKALAQSRFAFPSDDHPNYRTHLNVPQATLALEFGGGGGEKVFPDILVVEYPGNYPVMVAQVETRETVSREQAQRVWKNLENEEAPLYIYVPTGYGAVAKDYAKAAGIKRAQIRTWRRQPNGVVVQEV